MRKKFSRLKYCFCPLRSHCATPYVFILQPNMSRVKGDQRLANRMAVLQAAAANPALGASALAKHLAQAQPPVTVRESTVRSILKTYKDTDYSISSPKDRPRPGRPVQFSKRWKKYANGRFLKVLTKFFPLFIATFWCLPRGKTE